ncbi:hydrolase [Dietzia sp. PP-33]|mgnify:FL=1|jgi:predicted metallopeptidase|uniref:hydrolase n=1 Tax=Dietzia sp. PP-33 TaxID=2957500 RepID=UPI0029A79980|nr:hydrolase [Dietzia sp. PP-33]MDX2357526.1 hydrolase [Dietzia sp. PP-33]
MTSTDTVTQCATCGVEHAEPLPQVCAICADERQYVPAGGQRWTRPEESASRGASIEFTEREVDVINLVHRNCPGIGQKPALIRTDHGNVLVEVPNHINDEAVAAVRGWGGISAIIASHPHMYGVQSLWSAAFDDAPVYVSAPDEQCLGLRPRNTVVWGGGHGGAEIELVPGVRASQPGGHFPGSAVVHWTAPDGRGVLFTGDTIGSVADPGWVTFMRSFPNWMPLSGAVVRRIAEHVSRYDFDRIYSNFGGCVPHGARAAVQRSADRYAKWVDGEYDHLT